MYADREENGMFISFFGSTIADAFSALAKEPSRIKAELDRVSTLPSPTDIWTEEALEELKEYRQDLNNQLHIYTKVWALAGEGLCKFYVKTFNSTSDGVTYTVL
jgi:hypothetical protein